jgi:diaminohydroxyphosphoribosylaminopyrimidine deaminase/5-amino-6-(5-phosphoribosylamino)uracil reductase
MKVVDSDLSYMRLALREAKKGIGKTSPNPCVGAVVVKNDKVVGKGYHKRAGTPHAEIHALREAGKRAKGATLYVTLEPCNHEGRTPPCTEAVLRAGISRLVIGMLDPNPGVTGGGADRLASEGLAVLSGILERECREINLPFIKHTITGLPWVIMKAGISIDGKIAAEPGQSTRITGKYSLRRLHTLRNQVDAILIGINTALVDNPSLTTRLHGKGAGSKLEKAGVVVKTVPVSKGALNLKAVLTELGRAQITSVLVEGGSKVHGSFLQAGLVDQILLFVAPRILGDQGVPLATFSKKKKVDESRQFKIISTRRHGEDVLIDGRFNH